MPSSPDARRMAEQMNADEDRILDASRDEARGFLLRLRRDALSTPLRPEVVVMAVRRAAGEFEALVADSMVAAHLSGARRVIDFAAPRLASVDRFDLDDLIAELRSRLDLSPVTIQRVREVYGSEARVAALEATDNLSAALREASQDAINDGLTTAEARMAISRALDSQGFDAVNPWRVETVFRTQQALSYAAGQGAQARDALIDDVLWGYEYVTVGDDRVRPTHAALDGTRLPKDDPAWRRITPPNGWACRCTRVMVFDEEPVVDVPARAVVDGVEVIPGPDAGFDFDPADVFGVVKASVG